MCQQTKRKNESTTRLFCTQLWSVRLNWSSRKQGNSELAGQVKRVLNVHGWTLHFWNIRVHSPIKFCGHFLKVLGFEPRYWRCVICCLAQTRLFQRFDSLCFHSLLDTVLKSLCSFTLRQTYGSNQRGWQPRSLDVTVTRKTVGYPFNKSRNTRWAYGN